MFNAATGKPEITPAPGQQPDPVAPRTTQRALVPGTSSSADPITIDI